MFASAVLFSALASLAVAAPVARDATTSKAPPAGWAYGYLEPYNTYHTRYLALDCQDQHGTEFFDQCCHPLLATQTLHADRPSQCWPSADAESSASAAEATNASANGDAVSQYQAQATTMAVESSAPVSTTQQQAQPTQAPAQSEAAPSPSPSPTDNNNNNGGNNGGSGNWNYGGQATFFYQNGQPGACGNVNSDSTPLVAIDKAWWPDQGATESQYCGQWVQIVNTDNGNSVNAMVQDVCPTCSNANSLDLSTGAFDALGSQSSGVLPIKWQFL